MVSDHDNITTQSGQHPSEPFHAVLVDAECIIGSESPVTLADDVVVIHGVRSLTHGKAATLIHVSPQGSANKMHAIVTITLVVQRDNAIIDGVSDDSPSIVDVRVIILVIARNVNNQVIIISGRLEECLVLLKRFNSVISPANTNTSPSPGVIGLSNSKWRSDNKEMFINRFQ